MQVDEADCYDLEWKSHSTELLSALRQFRLEASLCDVTLVCPSSCNEGRNLKPVQTVFSAHKVILAACSTFFERVLCLPSSSCSCSVGLVNQDRVVFVVADTRPETLRLVLDFVYNGEVSVEAGDLEDFMDLAEKLEIRGVRTTSTEGALVEVKEENKESTENFVSPANRHTSSEIGGVKVVSRPKKSLPSISSFEVLEQGVEGDSTDGSDEVFYCDWGWDGVGSPLEALMNQAVQPFPCDTRGDVPKCIKTEDIQRYDRDARILVGKQSGGGTVHFCSVCGFVSSNVVHVQTHLYKHYPKKFTCPWCDLTYAKARTRLDHCFRVHGKSLSQVFGEVEDQEVDGYSFEVKKVNKKRRSYDSV